MISEAAFHVEEMLAGKIRTYQMEKRYFHKHGHVVHVLLAVSLIRDNDGKPVYFISQIMDITQRKLSEVQMKASLTVLGAHRGGP